MRGQVRCKFRCEACGERFVWDGRARALLCPCGRQPSRGIFVDLHYGKPCRRLKLYSTKRGQPFASGAEAWRTLEAIRLDIDADAFHPEDYIEKRLSEMRWEHYVKAYLDRLAERHAAGKVSANTLRLCRYICRRYLIPGLKGRDIRQLRAGHLEDFARRLKASDGTRAIVLTRLNAILHEAIRREDIDRIPVLPQVQRAELAYTVPTEEDRAAVFAKVPERHQPILRFLLHQPVRPAEACALRWSSVDLEAGTVRIERRTRKAGTTYELPLHPAILACLRARPREALTVFAHWHRGAWRPYTAQHLGAIWRDARAEAGVSCRLYDATRHYIATSAVRAGVDIGAVSKALGHSNIGITARTYAHYDAESLRRVIEIPSPASSPDRTQTP